MNITSKTMFRLALFCASAAPCLAAEQQLNVLLIVCDDLNTHVSTSEEHDDTLAAMRSRLAQAESRAAAARRPSPAP